MAVEMLKMTVTSDGTWSVDVPRYIKTCMEMLSEEDQMLVRQKWENAARNLFYSVNTLVENLVPASEELQTQNNG